MDYSIFKNYSIIRIFRISQQCLNRFRKNQTDFMRRFVTRDQTLDYHFMLEKSGFKIQDAKGILLIDYLEKR